MIVQILNNKLMKIRDYLLHLSTENKLRGFTVDVATDTSVSLARLQQIDQAVAGH